MLNTLMYAITYNLFLNKQTTKQKAFIILLCILVYTNVINFDFGLFSQYYKLINYFNTSENIILLLLFTYSVKTILLKPYNTTKVFLLLLLFWYVICVEYTVWDDTITNNKKINNNLLNGIMLIHPPTLYIGYACVFVSMTMCIAYIIQTYKQQKQYCKYYTNIYIIQNLLLVFSVLLGCWWAEQELSWGGWWNWDFVEILALVICLCSLVYTHEKFIYRCCLLNILFLLLLTFSIISVRYNIINSIHNFSLVNTTNQMLYYINTFIMLVIYAFCIFIKTTKIQKAYYYNTTTFYVLVLLLFSYYVLTYIDVKINILYIMFIKIIFFIITFLFLDFFYYGILYIIFACFCLSWISIYLTFACISMLLVLNSIKITITNTKYLIHLCLLFFLWFSVLQYYVFSIEDMHKKSYNIFLVKLNQSTRCLFVLHGVDFVKIFQNTFIEGLITVQVDIIMLIKGIILESIFGKNIVVYDNIYFENVIQENQQYVSFILYQLLLALSLLVLFFVCLVFSKQRLALI